MNAPAEKLAGDVKVLVGDVQELIRATAAQSGEKIAATRARVQAALADARETVVLQSRETAQATDQYVRQDPWAAMGVAAGVGALVGWLLGRR
jgi:ElaB/YqjD/DUF883 family membrane-anchored ribosome-binding protein